MFLGDVIMQTSTGSASLDSIASILLSVGIIAGVIAGFLKQSDKTKKYGQMLDTFSQKVVENDELTRRGFQAVVATVPEVNDTLKKYDAPLDYWDKRVKVSVEQLTDLRDVALPNPKERATAANIPREAKAVFQTS